MVTYLGWLLIGLVAGALARLFIPSRQPLGLLMTMLLGVIGSVIGGVISYSIFGSGFHTSGLMSTLGAIIVLGAYLANAQRRLPG